MNFFEVTSEFEVMQIISWLVPPRPTLNQLGDLAAFGETCKRFYLLSKSPEIWRSVDPGELVSSIVPKVRKLWLAQKLSRLGQLSHCRSLTLSFLPNSHALSLLLASPSIRELSISLLEPDECDATLVDRPTQHPGGRVSADTVVRAICSLPSLETLRLDVTAAAGAFAARFPPTLRRLEIDTRCDISSAFLCAGPFSSVSELSITAANQATIDAVTASCPFVRFLSLATFRSLSLRKFDSFKCSQTVERLELHAPVCEQKSISQLVAFCPNIRDLRLTGPFRGIADIAGFAKLDSLSLRSSLSTTVFLGDAEEFGKIGQSDGPVFRRLEFVRVSLDPTILFLGRRCHGLSEVELIQCSFTEQSVRALIDNSRDSIVSLSLQCTASEVEIASMLLADLPHLERLKLNVANDSELVSFASKCKSPLQSLQVFDVSDRSEVTDSGIRALHPCLAGVTELTLATNRVTAAPVLEFVTAFPQLKKLRLVYPVAKKVRPALSPLLHVDLEVI